MKLHSLRRKLIPILLTLFDYYGSIPNHHLDRLVLDELKEMENENSEAQTKATSPKMAILSQQKSDASLGGGFKYFLFSSLLGEMIQIDEHIFQMG